MDQFSRKFNIENYKNAMLIAKTLGVKPPRVHTFEILDGAFTWPRVRRYQSVQIALEAIEHFEDNLNLNITNLHAVKNFIRVGKAVVKELADQYGDAFIKP